MGLVFGAPPKIQGQIAVVKDFSWDKQGYTVCEARYEKGGPDDDNAFNKGLVYEEIGFFKEKEWSEIFIKAAVEWRKQNPFPEPEDKTEKYITTEDPWKHIKKNTRYRPAGGLNWIARMIDDSDKSDENTLRFTEEEFKKTFSNFPKGAVWEIKT